MEDYVARAAARAVVGEEVGIREFASFGVNVEDADAIGAEIADQEEAIVGRDRDTVGMGIVLPAGDRTEGAELRMVFEVEAFDWLAQSAVGLDAVRGDG